MIRDASGSESSTECIKSWKKRTYHTLGKSWPFCSHEKYKESHNEILRIRLSQVNKSRNKSTYVQNISGFYRNQIKIPTKFKLTAEEDFMRGHKIWFELRIIFPY